MKNLLRRAICGALLTCVLTSCASAPVHHLARRHHDFALQYLALGKCRQAEERCRIALEYGDHFAHAHHCLGMVELICRNEMKRAASHFKDAIARNSDFAAAHANLGVTFLKRNPPDYEAAADQFFAAIEIDPAHVKARENLGLALLRNAIRSGDPKRRNELFESAISQLIRLAELDPNNAEAWHYLGLIELERGRPAQAEQPLLRCIGLAPNLSECHYNLGYAYLATARCEDAIAALVAALRIPDSPVEIEARRNLAVAQNVCARKDGALQRYLDLIAREPGNPAYHYDLAAIFAAKGQLDRAVSEWQATLSLEPGYCPAYARLAHAADDVLDSDGLIHNCTALFACARSSGISTADNDIEWCRHSTLALRR